MALSPILRLLARVDFEAGDVGLCTKEGVWLLDSVIDRTKDMFIVRAQKPIKAGTHGPFKESDNPNAYPFGI